MLVYSPHSDRHHFIRCIQHARERHRRRRLQPILFVVPAPRLGVDHVKGVCKSRLAARVPFRLVQDTSVYEHQITCLHQHSKLRSCQHEEDKKMREVMSKAGDYLFMCNIGGLGGLTWFTWSHEIVILGLCRDLRGALGRGELFKASTATRKTNEAFSDRCREMRPWAEPQGTIRGRAFFKGDPEAQCGWRFGVLQDSLSSGWRVRPEGRA